VFTDIAEKFLIVSRLSRVSRLFEAVGQVFGLRKCRGKGRIRTLNRRFLGTSS